MGLYDEFRFNPAPWLPHSDLPLEELERIRNIKREDMEYRLNLMKQNPESIFVSIHLNKFTTSAARGSQVFYSKLESSKLLADLIQNSIIFNHNYENSKNLNV